MAFEVPPLPYDYGALEPTIDEETMRLHHDKHHQAYVDNANAALEGTPWADKSVEQVLANLDAIPEEKRTAVRLSSGRRSISTRTCSTGRSAHCVPARAAFALSTYAWWCLSWWSRIVSSSIVGSSAP
jgi:nitrate/nitrite-specific signal transduction histidine kinase